jgi:hypothetical protein
MRKLERPSVSGEEISPKKAQRITVIGKSWGRYQGVGSGYCTDDPCDKRVGREGPGPAGILNGKVRQW